MSLKVKGKKQIYEVTNLDTGEKSFQPATTAYNACKQAGWLIEGCFTVLAIQRWKPVPRHAAINLIRIPCEVCPYQWAECKKGAQDDCPCRREMPDLNEWLAEITKSHLCEFVGESLTKTDYRQFQKWIPLAEAIKELSPQR